MKSAMFQINWEQIKRGQSYANAIVLSGERQTKILIPSFGYEKTEAEIARRLEQIGRVIFIWDHAHAINGNMHCLTGAIAKNFLERIPRKREA